ncbi:MAG: ABC transporter ATP-binding protein [Bacteroidota bacterium]
MGGGAIVADNLSYKYASGETVFRHLGFRIESGEFIVILGKSGGGKTTLLKVMAGLLPEYKGNLLIDGQDLREASTSLGFVFQDFALFPWLNTQKNIEFGLKLKGLKKELRDKKSKELMQLTGLSSAKNKFPHQLSGGMQQRAAIARVLAIDPKIMLLDEPFGALDYGTRTHLQQFLLSIWQQFQKTIIFVTHSVEEALTLGQRILLLRSQGLIEIPVTLPYPRNVAGTDFNGYRRQLLNEFMFDDKKSQFIGDE